MIADAAATFHDMSHGLPILPTTVVGSYAHPSWFYAAKELMEAERFGPVDVEETFDDAVDRAILDQEEAVAALMKHFPDIASGAGAGAAAASEGRSIRSPAQSGDVFTF